jgi:hypothetical protein
MKLLNGFREGVKNLLLPGAGLSTILENTTSERLRRKMEVWKLPVEFLRHCLPDRSLPLPSPEMLADRTSRTGNHITHIPAAIAGGL